MSNILVFVLELIGTVAFAVSGAIVGIKKQMDLLGVIVLGVCTAVGGGIVRDLILGITPPAAFQSPGYALTAITVSALVFLPPVRRLLHWNEKLYDTALLLFDAIGLGIFTVIGVQTAYIATGELNAFLAIFVGVVTGCGGGVMRDVFAGSPPYIFVKHFYATASLLGAVACLLLWNIGQMPAMLIGAAVTLTLRLLAAHYRWSLPKAK